MATLKLPFIPRVGVQWLKRHDEFGDLTMKCGVLLPLITSVGILFSPVSLRAETKLDCSRHAPS